MPIAHYNIARLRALPGHPLVAEFVDNAPRVNAVAERSPGFLWRHDDSSEQVAEGVTFQALHADPHLASSLSVWESVSDLEHFVRKTVHGAFLRRRVEWFTDWEGPNYVLWSVDAGAQPPLAEGAARLARLAKDGSGADSFDFAWARENGLA